MIEVKSDGGVTFVEEIRGTNLNVLSDLACICQTVLFCMAEDEPKFNELKKRFIEGITKFCDYNTLKDGETNA